jgi:hypothetical protein
MDKTLGIPVAGGLTCDMNRVATLFAINGGEKH